MNKTYTVQFIMTDLGLYGAIPGLKEAMERELIRVYNLYADKSNNGVTDLLNEEFDRLYPDYFESNRGKEWYDLTEYNTFMANGYQRLVVDEFNKTNISPILDFYVDPEDAGGFTGMLKVNHDITISFYLKEA